MDFTLDTEQEALRDAVRRLLSTSYAAIDGRREATAKDPGFDEGMWQRLAEMGVLGLPFAEEDGGSGAGPVEVALVAEQIGSLLAPEPFVEAIVLAGRIVAAAGSPAQRAALLTAIADGSIVPALAHLEPGHRATLPASVPVVTAVPEVTAVPDGDGWRLDGVKEPVFGGARADLLVVTAAVDGHTALFTVDAGSAGLERVGYPTYDGGRAARVTFARTRATALGDPTADATDVVRRAMAHAQVAYCHEAVGAMDTALTTTAEYLRTRRQFGVPLKTFQALTFRAADMYVSLELARSMALWATLVLTDADEAVGTDGASAATAATAPTAPTDAVTAASRAKLAASTAARHIGQEAIQLHGGIGMTAEYSVGHYAARLTAIDHLLGDGAHHLRELSRGVAAYGVVEPLDD